MVFNSFQFLIFVVILFLVFYSFGKKSNLYILFLASIVYYASFHNAISIYIILGVITIAYVMGKLIDNCKDQFFKKVWLVSGIILIIMPLLFFKDFAFINQMIISALGMDQTQIMLLSTMGVIGISYFTFQAISYLIDIFLGICHAERNIVKVSLYFLFFCKVVQGPIERAGDLIPQFKWSQDLNYSMILSGFMLFLYGLIKKIIIADNLGSFVDPVYGSPHNSPGSQLLIAVNFYSLQIYFDFSGYTDMALGISRLFNIRLTENFNNPYFASSIADFWRRWHISLSKWLMDYIFKPIQMKFREFKQYSTMAAIFTTFVICGLWHGAAWHYILWGVLHGILMIIGVGTQSIRKCLFKKYQIKYPRIYLAWQILFTYSLVSILWIFFRSKSITDAIIIINSIFQRFEPEKFQFSYYYSFVFLLAWTILGLELGNWPRRLIEKWSCQKLTLVKHFSFTLIYLIIIIMLFIIMYSYKTDSNQPFIYMQF